MRTLSLCLLLLAVDASAQVNTEKFRGAEDPGFHGFLDGSLAFRTGNAPRLTATGVGRLGYRAERVHYTYGQGEVRYGDKGADHERYLNRLFGHLRWTAMWHEQIGSEVFGQLQFDEFLRLKLRVLAGGGVRVETEPVEELLEIALGTGLMMEHEVLDIDSTNAHARESLNVRSTSYLTLRLNLSPTLTLSSTTYYQPKVDDFTDFRILEEAALEVKVTEHLSFVTSFSLAHDSKPPDGVESTDIVFAPKLRVSW